MGNRGSSSAAPMPTEYIIYCDESTKRGRLFSNFYGGLLVRSTHLDLVRRDLENLKSSLNLGKELKWVRVTENYEQKYLDFLNVFFNLVEQDVIKVRVMFTQNIHVPVLSKAQLDKSYFLLYYQFIKWGFGLRYSNNTRQEIDVRVYPDYIPHTKENTEQFKAFIANLSLLPALRAARIRIRRENVTEINSADHILAQCVDIVLGAMQFRLNRMHKEKQEGERVRGKRTRAKERVYDYIRSRANQMHKNFNIGITTGTNGNPENRWHQPYRHWRFVPKEYRMANAGRRQADEDDEEEG